MRLFYKENESDDTVVQPDITIVCDEEKRGSEGCRGAPSLVVEILSPSNSATEMQRKFSLYKKAGVREYLVVNPETKEVTVFLFGENPGFNVYKSDDVIPVAVLPGLDILLEQVFAE